MRITLRSVAVGVSSGVTVLLAALPWLRLPAACAAEDFVRFVGRAHPLVLHFPIVLLLLAVVLETATWPGLRRVVPATSEALRSFVWGAAAWSAAFSAFAGWLLAQTSSQEPALLKLHLFTGAATAALALLAWTLRLLAGSAIADSPPRASALLARLALFASALLLLPAGHAGAGLTHGEDFLSRYAPSAIAPLLGPTKPATPPATPTPNVNASADRLVFRDVIRPVLDHYCTNCHGEKRAKGKLRLDSRAAILVGGETGAAAKPGLPAESLLLKRIHLPLDDDDHMPPADKDQPTKAELALLEWWIQAGLPGDVPLTQISVPQSSR